MMSLRIIHKFFYLIFRSNISLFNEKPSRLTSFFIVYISCLIADQFELINPIAFLFLFKLILQLYFIIMISLLFSIEIGKSIPDQTNDCRDWVADNKKRKCEVKVQIFVSKVDDTFLIRILCAQNDSMIFSELPFKLYFYSQFSIVRITYQR